MGPKKKSNREKDEEANGKWQIVQPPRGSRKKTAPLTEETNKIGSKETQEVEENHPHIPLDHLNRPWELMEEWKPNKATCTPDEASPVAAEPPSHPPGLSPEDPEEKRLDPYINPEALKTLSISSEPEPQKPEEANDEAEMNEHLLMEVNKLNNAKKLTTNPDKLRETLSLSGFLVEKIKKLQDELTSSQAERQKATDELNSTKTTLQKKEEEIKNQRKKVAEMHTASDMIKMMQSQRELHSKSEESLKKTNKELMEKVSSLEDEKRDLTEIKEDRDQTIERLDNERARHISMCKHSHERKEHYKREYEKVQGSYSVNKPEIEFIKETQTRGTQTTTNKAKQQSCHTQTIMTDQAATGTQTTKVVPEKKEDPTRWKSGENMGETSREKRNEDTRTSEEEKGDKNTKKRKRGEERTTKEHPLRKKQNEDSQVLDKLETYYNYDDYDGKLPRVNDHIALRWAETDGWPDQEPDLKAILDSQEKVTRLLKERQLQLIFNKEDDWEPNTREDPHTEEMWKDFREIKNTQDGEEYMRKYYNAITPGFCKERGPNARKCTMGCTCPVGTVNQASNHIIQDHSHVNKQGVYCIICPLNNQKKCFKTPGGLMKHLQKEHEKMWILYSMGPKDGQPRNVMKAWLGFIQLITAKTIDNLQNHLGKSYFDSTSKN